MAAPAYNAAVLIPLSITDRYSHEMGIVHIFEEINLGGAERNRFFNDGLNSVGALVETYGYDVKSFKVYLESLNKTFATAGAIADRVYFTPPIIMKLCGALFYFNHCVYTLHAIPDVMEADGDFLLENYEHYSAITKEKDDDEDDSEVRIPKLKGHENWIQWRDAFMADLANTVGMRGISIDYVVNTEPRDTTHGNAARTEFIAVNLEDEGLFLAQAVHFGPTYKSDNSKVWRKLKTALINSPPYNTISGFNDARNGRGAWEALLLAYQGSDFNERMRDSAFDTLNQAHYRGETRNFSWEKYVEIHKAAHKKLIDSGYNAGVGLDEETKIQYLKANICPEAGLENSLSIARVNNTYRYDFDLFVSFMSSEVNNRTDRKKQLDKATLRVAAVSGRDRNRRGSRQSCNSAYVPDAVKWDDRQSRVVDGKTVYAARYPKDRFSKLTNNQRKAIIEMKAEYNARKRGGNNPNLVAAMQAVQDDMTTMENRIVSAITRATDEPGDDGASNVSGVTMDSKRKAAPAGSIGSFLASQNKKKKGGS